METDVRDSQMPTEKNYFTGKSSVQSEASNNSIMVRLNPEPAKDESKVYKSSFGSSKQLGSYKQERETLGYHPSITDPNASPDTLLQLDTISEIVPAKMDEKPQNLVSFNEKSNFEDVQSTPKRWKDIPTTESDFKADHLVTHEEMLVTEESFGPEAHAEEAFMAIRPEAERPPCLGGDENQSF